MLNLAQFLLSFYKLSNYHIIAVLRLTIGNLFFPKPAYTL